MEAVYYILILLLVVGVPFLGIGFIASILKPDQFNKGREQKWSRGKIAGSGAGIIATAVILLCIGINATMPQHVRDEIDAKNAAVKQIQDTQKQKAEVTTQNNDDTPKSEVKSEVVVVPIQYAVIEKTDSTLPSGQRRVTIAGVAGERTETYSVTYLDNKQVSKNLAKSEITKIPVDQVVSVGTYVAPSAPAQNNVSNNQSTQQQAAPSNSSVYYANCTAVRAAGAAPIYRGQPGYRSALDRDDDGIGCE